MLIHDGTDSVAGAVEFLQGGTSIVVLGGGFQAGEGISIMGTAATTPLLLGSAVANSHGAFMATIDLPGSFSVGPSSVYTVTASGEQTGDVYGVFVLVDKIPNN